MFDVSVNTPETVGMSSERLARIRPVMQGYVDRDEVPGIATMIARKGKVVHQEAIGFMDKAQEKALQPDTIFRLASMTKPIIGALTMVLFEEGHFGPNDRLDKYLPEFADMKVRTVNAAGDVELVDAAPITIKHLLTHTAGLPYFVSADEVGMGLRKDGLTGVHARLGELNLENYVKKLATYPLTAQPGTEWRYSEGMCVLGRLAELVSGMSLGEVMKDRLFDPLGMVDTGFYVPADKADRLSHLYLPEVPFDPNWPTSNGGDFCTPPTVETGSSGLVSTIQDYTRFALMLANGGELDGVRVLSPLTVDLMMSNHLGDDFGKIPLNTLGAFTEDNSVMGEGVRFGFTGSVVTDPAPTAGAWSEGDFSWGGGFGTHFWIDRKHDMVAIIMTQAPATAGPTHVKMHHLTRQAVVDV